MTVASFTTVLVMSVLRLNNPETAYNRGECARGTHKYGEAEA